ncbi:MAG: type IX secretion system membrane protein PorP/SprF [Bacteroidetes bacterium]|nr:type IX secretion system membrane protein PorP/SprF [Bacteroidota bacterium]
MKKTVIIFLAFVPALLFAQQDALFTQYMYTKLEFNPAYTGSHEGLSLDLLGRFQWVGIQGAPRTLCLTAHTPLPNQHLGLGMYVYMDQLGPAIDYNVMGTFAYRILFPNSKLCFGLSAGIKYYDIDWTALNPKDAGDPALTGQVKNKVVPDADFGIYYYSNKYYAGASVKHLFQNQILVSNTVPDGQDNFTRLLRTWYFIGGGTIPLYGNVQLMPSLLIKYVPNSPIQADVSARVRFLEIITLGAAYRTNDALCLLMELVVYKGLSLGYSYDIWFNALKGNNQGSHEIRIGYDIDLFKARMLSPRYF